MNRGGWTPISKGFLKSLPHDRAYTELEAAYCMQLDYDDGNSVTVAGYASLWRWSRPRVMRFLKKMDAEIIYPENTANHQNQKGKITIQIPIQIPSRSEKKTTQIRLIDSKGLQGERYRSENETIQIPSRSRYTTIYPKNLDTNISSKHPPIGEVLTLWHKILPELPKPRKVTATRKKHFKARWHGDYQSSNGLKSDSVDFWQGFFQYIRKSDFLMGRNSKWQATFDWIIKESNFVKIQEGNYHK